MERDPKDGRFHERTCHRLVGERHEEGDSHGKKTDQQNEQAAQPDLAVFAGLGVDEDFVDVLDEDRRQTVDTRVKGGHDGAENCSNEQPGQEGREFGADEAEQGRIAGERDAFDGILSVEGEDGQTQEPEAEQGGQRENLTEPVGAFGLFIG